MRTVRIAHPVGAVLLLGLVPGCSENNELDPGTFLARLSGARTEALSGSAVAGVVFSEHGVSYTISMLDQGDEFVFLTVLCPGEEAPAPGNHPLGTTESGCSASYRRTVNDPFTTIEQADAVSGSLVVRESGRGAIAGRLDFTGPLVAAETQEGDLNGRPPSTRSPSRPEVDRPALPRRLLTGVCAHKLGSLSPDDHQAHSALVGRVVAPTLDGEWRVTESAVAGSPAADAHAVRLKYEALSGHTVRRQETVRSERG